MRITDVRVTEYDLVRFRLPVVPHGNQYLGGHAAAGQAGPVLSPCLYARVSTLGG